MRPSHVRAVLEREFRAASEGVHTPVMLWGPPGVGKSRIAADVAADHRVPLIDIRLSQMEPTDLRGIPFRVGDRVEWSVPAMLPDAHRHGERGILLLDELTSAPPTVTAAAYQLILDRKLGEYTIPAGWPIFAAGNRYGDRGVTYVMPAPLANRFTHYEIEPHLEDWVDWAHRHAIDWRIIAFLRFRPDLLFEFDPARNPVAFPSPRSWEYANRAMLKFESLPGVLVDALQACVGPACGIELAAFLQHMHDMPDVDAIARGESSIVPARLDIQYGVAAALVRKAQRAAADAEAESIMRNILRYASVLPQREMGVMLVTDMHRTIGQPLYGLPEFKAWASGVSDLLLYDRALPGPST